MSINLSPLSNSVTSIENIDKILENGISLNPGKETVTEFKNEEMGTDPQVSDDGSEHENETGDIFTEAEMHQIEEMHESFLHYNENGNLE